MQMLNRLTGALGSTKLTLVILAVFAVAIAIATFIESGMGTVAARVLVYNAWWFEALLAFLVINLVVALLIHMPYKVRQTGYVLTHIGFIVVIVSAGATRYFGYEGRMPIREGASTDYMFSSEDHVQIEVDGEWASYPIRLYKPGETSISRNLEIGGEKFRVSLGEYWTNFDRHLVESPGGNPVAVLSGPGIGQRVVLPEGRSKRPLSSLRIGKLEGIPVKQDLPECRVWVALDHATRQ